MRYFSVIICCCFFTCSSNHDDEILATYGDDHLLLLDIYNDIPLNNTDTNILIKKYIDNWLRKQVVLDQAYLYIDYEDSDIDRIVQNYKDDLVLQTYKNELSRSKFDTVVSEKDISKYYYDNQQTFMLMKDIFKARLIVLQKNNVVLSDLQDLIDASSDEDLYKLMKLCRSYSVDYILNDSIWRYSSDFTFRLPFIEKESYDRLFLKNKIFNFTDDKYDYILFIKDFKINGETSPLSFEYNNIKNLIQSQRVKMHIEEIEDNLYNKALLSGEIKIYYEK